MNIANTSNKFHFFVNLENGYFCEVNQNFLKG